MKIHLEELGMARAYTQGHTFEDLSSEQVRLILNRGRELYKWFKAHPRTHAMINGLVIALFWGWIGWSCCSFPVGFCPRAGGRDRACWWRWR